MTDKKMFCTAIIFILLNFFIYSEPYYSPTWGFLLDLPEGYKYSNGDGKERFSFETQDGAKFDLAVYQRAPGRRTNSQGNAGAAAYASLEDMARDVRARLNVKSEPDFFEYRQKKACLIELAFSVQGPGAKALPMTGWALCMELGFPNPAPGNNAGGAAGRANNVQTKPLLMAMAYGPAGKDDLQILHLSALDSIAPEQSDLLSPGPITEYSYPRETRVKTTVFNLGLEAWIYKEDAEAAQALIDREFKVLTRYTNSPKWQEAWTRFYRAIYRDSFERLVDIAFQVERKLNVPAREDRDLADQALQWVQSFAYERNLLGSDFENLISAATLGKGDCDSRAMLWAIILKQANIPSAMMVSRHYSHAMGLAELEGQGARFEVKGRKLLVAETTAKVSIGLIGETVSEITYWLGIEF